MGSPKVHFADEIEIKPYRKIIQLPQNQVVPSQRYDCMVIKDDSLENKDFKDFLDNKRFTNDPDRRGGQMFVNKPHRVPHKLKRNFKLLSPLSEIDRGVKSS